MILYYEKEEKTTGKTTIDSDVSEGTFVEVEPDLKIVMTGAFDSEDPDFEENLE